MFDFRLYTQLISQSFAFLKRKQSFNYFIPGIFLTLLFYILFDFQYFGYKNFSWDNLGYYISYQAYYFLTFILLSPFLSKVSSDVFKYNLGIKTSTSILQFGKDLIRFFILLGALFFLQLILIFLWWILSLFLPDFFSILDVVFDYSLKFLLFGCAFVDYSLERDQWSVFNSLKFFWKEKINLIFIGLFFLILMNVPLVGLIVAPVFCTVLATNYYLITKKSN